jgi:hypothetical protein
MKLNKEVPVQEVWDDWMRGEGMRDPHFRSDIREPLPADAKWYSAELERQDIRQLFIISSDDWTEISAGTFLVERVLQSVNAGNFQKADSARISKKITDKIGYLKSGGPCNSHLILVSSNSSGPFTLIEGNHRAVAHFERGTLVGLKVYLGVSLRIRKYPWARKSFCSKLG